MINRGNDYKLLAELYPFFRSMEFSIKFDAFKYGPLYILSEWLQVIICKIIL